ncbi:unnamed protein product [Phaedon cochleariae]|uniref:Dynein regulatory complex protein 1 n=1 Tax=Phaedon cochleariae TaxID=80249 RepID=A0A9N9SB04_PHACE|nr:unnamed protein product [Phaedon cochleariae]
MCVEEPSNFEHVDIDEPQVTSEDPNERKLARKLRIERRWTVIRRTIEPDVEVLSHRSPVQVQVAKSADILEKFLQEADEYVSNVRVANDAREVDRRETEGIGREKVIAQLEAEAEAAKQMFEEIAIKWSVIQKYNDPLHINEDVVNQKEKCDALVKQKDGIIAMLREELKNSEKKFTKDQKKQTEDIHILTQRIEKQITFMRSAYQNEFELIEEVIAAERQNFIDSHNRKWEELYKKRQQEEIKNSDKKFEQLEHFNKNMNRLRIDFQEKFRETKIKLENNIENLQRELERIKALALLNSEKLDYNYQILKKREDENIIIKSQQKRRMNKLQDVINDLRKKITDHETTTNNRLKKFSDDIKKLHKNILEVEAKADHFAKVNDDNFHQIWEMNRANCQKILTKILSTDKILHEQQMGMVWVQPQQNLIQKTALPSYKDALNVLDSLAPTASNKPSISTLSDMGQKSRKHTSADFEENKTKTPHQLDLNPQYRKLLKYILTLVSEKSGFLTENRLKSLIKMYEDDQKTLVRLDSVFGALGIQRDGDIDLLVKYFLPYCYCPVCAGQDNAQDSAMSRYASQVSHLSSAFSRIGNDEDFIEIVELNQAFSAIQQPYHVIEEVVMDLVTSDMYMEDKEINQDSLDGPEKLCAVVVSDQYSPDVKDKKQTKKKTFIMEDKVLCQYNHPLVLNSIYILVALKDFVIAYYKQNEGFPTTRARLERKRHTISRLLNINDIKMFWEKYKTVFNEDRIRVWDALLEGLKHYHEILKERKNMCEEVVELRKQNNDLKKLLANYIDHGEFMSSPCTLDKGHRLIASPPIFSDAKRK